MVTIEAVETYCTNVEYQLVADCPDALMVTWVGIPPSNVSADEIKFTAPNNLVTGVTVPVEGSYSFYARCCK